jgi:tRNA U34 5-methylaminomethyl-2-thiouridine-forming methyltransferase MnmC
LSLFQNKQISILEIGFGTGLNAFIIEGKQNESINRLRRVEAYPVSAEELVSMNYVEELNAITRVFLIKCIKVIGEKRESRR